MSLMKRMMAMALSAMLLLAPVSSSAEEMLSSYFAGEMMQQVVARGYEAGDQLTLNAALPVTLSMRDRTMAREDMLHLTAKVMERLLARMDA